MQWADIGPLVAGLAPTLGKMLGGAIGGPFGAMIGSTAGDILAKSLGVPATPEAVHAAVSDDSSPGKAAMVTDAILRAERDAQAQWQALTAIAQAEADVAKTEAHETGETMRSELQLGSLATGHMRDIIVLLQASWRPIAMYVWVGTWPWQLWFAFYQTATEAARAAALSNLTWWNTMPAVLAGAYSIGRSFEKITDSGGVAGKVVSLVKRR